MMAMAEFYARAKQEEIERGAGVAEVFEHEVPFDVVVPVDVVCSDAA